MLAFADQAIVSGTNFLTMLLMARLLAVEAFGFFSLAFICCLFLSNVHRAFFTQPLNVLGAREDRQQLLRRLGSILKAHVVAIPAGAIFLTLAAWLFFPDVRLMTSAAAYLACFAVHDTLRRYWYTTGELGNAVLNDLVCAGFQATVLLLLWHFSALGPSTAFLAMALASLAAFVNAARKVPIAPLPDRPTTQALLRQHLPIAKWLVLTALAVWGAGQVYPFLIAPLGAAAVASFAACRNLLNAVGLFVQSVGNYLPSRAAALLAHSGKAAFVRHLLQTCTQATAVGAAFLMLVWWLAEPLLSTLYAGQYDHATEVLRILAFGTFCSLIGAILGAYAIALGDSRSCFLSNVGASVTTFTVGLWLISTDGLYGAAIATALSLATATLLQAFFVALRLWRPSN